MSCGHSVQIVNDSPVWPDQIEDDNIIFADETTDEAPEAAASGPVVTFALSVVLFACLFC